MRIISGCYRGRKLRHYFCGATRPTTDRVKENVFNTLANYIDFSGIKVLDLFAGTGQYGLECLSRGAGFVHFNDYNEKAVSVIKENLSGVEGNYKITDKNYLDAPSGKYDLVFLDPPYASNFGEIAIKKLLPSGAIIVFETDKEFIHENIFAVKKYGRANVYLLKSPLLKSRE
jgi:16S rRNA (guanine966-N2)-methyltransferase